MRADLSLRQPCLTEREIVKSYANECYISENEKKEFNMTVLPLGENQHIEMYVWDSLTDKNLLIYDVVVH